MSFLAPLFLVGGLIIAAPIIFHLIRQTSKEKRPFSSLMFLDPTPPRVTRRSRLEHLLLLLLRCAIVLLLAFGFARPFIKKPMAALAGTTPAKRVVVLVDASASMQRASLWPQAMDKATAVLKSLGPEDQVSLVTFDRQIRTLVSFDQWQNSDPGQRVDTALARLREARPSWVGTALAQALTQVLELMQTPGDGAQSPDVQQIVLISDLQQGSRVEALQSFEWPKKVQLVVDPVRVSNRSNAGLAVVPEGTETEVKKEEGIKVRVTNSSESKKEQFQLRWDTGATAVPVYVPAGRSRVFTAPKKEGARLVLSGDDEPFDNNLYPVELEPARLKVVYFGPDAPADSTQLLYYLRRAFPETRRQVVELVSYSASQSLPAEGLADVSLVVLGDRPGDSQTKAVEQFLNQGGTGLLVVQKESVVSLLESWLSAPSLSVSEARVSNYAMLGQLDFQHPLFLPFNDPRFSDFTKIHFWKYRKMEAPSTARVLAHFDSGDPALFQNSVGRGNLFVLLSGWHPADSQLALSSKFVPLMFSLLEVAGVLKNQSNHFLVGDVVPIEPRTGVTVQTPDGREIAVTNGLFSATSTPGFYLAVHAGKTNRFSVNLDPVETRTAALPEDEFVRRGVAMKTPLPVVTPNKERLHGEQLESRQKLWRWFVVAALMLLLLETWLSKRMTVTPTPAPADAAAGVAVP